MPLKQAIKNLDAALNDLTSLHVQTYSGTLKLAIADGQEAERFKSINESIKTPPSGQSVNLALETLVKFDGDAYNFVSDDATQALIDTHKNAVDSSLKSRQAMLDMFVGLFE